MKGELKRRWDFKENFSSEIFFPQLDGEEGQFQSLFVLLQFPSHTPCLVVVVGRFLLRDDG